MIDVGGDDRPPARHLIADEFRIPALVEIDGI
ncbi:hypothetical protein X742_20210 [Mesorhizobium sp. LNHC232B00]|nr:hypothetical protein X742_20210 [Mesorhizobium sp. LNHC232B00]